MVPGFDEYFSKFGFGDGDYIEDQDFAARDWLVYLLNDTAAFKQNSIRAFSYDRPGMHNSCMIIVTKATQLLLHRDPLDDDGLLELLDSEGAVELNEGETEDLLHSAQIEVSDLIMKAYDLARSGKKPKPSTKQQ